MENKPPAGRRPEKPVLLIRNEPPARQLATVFPVVGIAASAGGFEALEAKLQDMQVTLENRLARQSASLAQTRARLQDARKSPRKAAPP